MILPAEIWAIYERYLAVFPLWKMPAGELAEERARQWTIGLAEQINFEFPAGDTHGIYGCKRADSGRPVSKDSIALLERRNPNQMLEEQKILGWDMLSGAGSGSPQRLAHPPDSIDISDQVFIPVRGEDHIGGAEPGPTPPQPEPPPVIAYREDWSVEFGTGCNHAQDELVAGGKPRSIDGGMISVHSSRAAWDVYVGGLPWHNVVENGVVVKQGSYEKHLNDYRREYGLPALP